ncbi:hypothetical protein EsH8_VI_001169 [Colletotrichum jinshuiense]
MAKRGYLLLTVLVGLLGVLISRRRGPTDDQRPTPIVGRNNTVLFLVNVEHGLSNVHVATAFSLIEHHPEVTVHFASWSKLRDRTDKLSAFARKRTPSSPPVVFHELPPPNFYDAGKRTSLSLMQPPGIAGNRALSKDMQQLVSPWSGPDYLKIYKHVSGLIQEIDPAVVVLETFMRPGADATRDANRLYAVLTPNMLSECFGEQQPWMGVFWKYPAIGSGLNFPVPWRDIPSNIYQVVSFISSLAFGAEISAKRKFLVENGMKNPLRLSDSHRPGTSVLISQDTAGSSIPVEFVPPNVTATGPIVVGVAPVEDQDPELAAWLARSPTVLVNLGSVLEYDAARARPMAAALRAVLERTNVQIIWKLHRAEGLDDETWKPLLEEFIANDRIRVSRWLTVDPAALLESGHIVASVHHGGANCYHEAIAAGVPHLILPAWLDHYNYAARVEEIELGVWGNKKAAPGFSVDELTSAFLRLLDDGPASASMRENAKRLRGTLARPGRDIAGDEIARLAATGH